MLINKLKSNIRKIFEDMVFCVYRWTVPYRLNKIRRKQGQIKVLFLLTNLNSWKTEELYNKMLIHSRFDPLLGIVALGNSASEMQKLVDYLKMRKYRYIDLDTIDTNKPFDTISPDIIFYQVPYEGCYTRKYSIRWNLKYIYCFVSYAFNDILEEWARNQPILKLCAQNYFENTSCAAEISRYCHFNNLCVTGVPIQDELMLPQERYENPWRSCGLNKKRIIYAPHHTLPGMHLEGIAYSTFLDNAQFMLEMVEKYKDKVQWSFKPHPLLYSKLVKLWGQDKTDSYYHKWRDSENCQFNDGRYYDLFVHSDALIHDCSSFSIEYHLTHKPVLYLVNGDDKIHTRNLVSYAKIAYNLHYKAKKHAEIEQFIINVINGLDPMAPERQQFFDEYLLPPNGKSACENIINSILGEAEYSAKV
jgi:hypothetical protein